MRGTYDNKQFQKVRHLEKMSGSRLIRAKISRDPLKTFLSKIIKTKGTSLNQFLITHLVCESQPNLRYQDFDVHPLLMVKA